MRHIKLTLQYDGTEYSGWQIQKKDSTIQGILEDAVFAVTGEKLRVNGASRTDAGVHAMVQAADFRTHSSLEPLVLARALNANIPRDIQIIDAEEAPENFHPRYSAKSKTYSYLITRSGTNSVFLRKYSWQIPYKLDHDAMQEAAAHLIGRHDFSSFRGSGCSSKHPVREITNIQVSALDTIDFMTFILTAPTIKISIQANAFLRHMVRNIVGTLVETGRGITSPVKIKEIMDAKDRRAAGQTAPACGLFLERIEY